MFRRFEKAIDSGAEGDVLVFMPGGYEIARGNRGFALLRCLVGFEELLVHFLPMDDRE